MIKNGRMAAHRACMLAALSMSALFLGSYLYYHAHAGHVVYHGPVRPLYLAILTSHTILAVLILPMILRTVHLAVNDRFEEHQRAAKWTFPAWMYVSVTGVVVYLMLYQLPQGA
jgi:putative membrane protein